MGKFHYFIIICFISISVLSVYIAIPDEHNFYKNADEGHYFKYGSIIAKKGILAYPSIIKSYLNNPQSYLYPTLFRPGYLLLTALWFKFFGISYIILAKFSFFCYLLFILVCTYFSKKFFSKDISYLFALLLSSSPLVMAMGKRALMDSCANLFLALTVWTFMDFLITNKKNKFLIFLITYSFCITVKESSVALLVFFAMVFLIHKYYFKNPISYAYLFYIIFIPLITVGVSYLVLFGGVTNFVGLIKGLLDAHFGSVRLSRYAVLFCTGPWYRYIIDYLLLNPVTTLLFIGYFGYVLVSRKWEWKIVYFLLYFVIIFTIFSNLRYSKVVRFVINLDMVINLYSVFMLYALFRQNDNKKEAQLVFISVAVIFLLNYLNFVYLFCQFNIYDPVTYWLLAAKKLIPYAPNL